MLYLTSLPPCAEGGQRREHEAGRALLAFAVREEYGISHMPRMEKGIYGKPYFPDFDRIYFNISHSAGMAVCALAGTEIGVDIDHVRKVREGMYSRVLSESERKWIAGQPDREEAFIRLWTLKESYIKATGEGLSAPLPSVDFTLPDRCGEGVILCSQEGYSFCQYRIGEKNYLALCVKGEGIPDCLEKLHIIF